MYRSHVRAVYSFLAYSVSKETAEDLTADTFERAIRAWDRFDPERASERTWILSIARNAMTDYFRRQSRRASVSSDAHPELLDAVAGGEDPLTHHLQVEGLTQLLASVSPREREVLAMRYGAGLSARDVADVMQMTEANVHQVASRGLRKLRPLVERPSGTPEPFS